jgi:hypothetical protein
MGEPAFQLPEEDRPDIRPHLRALEGGGNTSESRQGHLSSVDEDHGAGDGNEKLGAEASEQHSLYNAAGNKKVDAQSDEGNKSFFTGNQREKGGSLLDRFKGTSRTKRTIAIAGTALAILGFGGGMFGLFSFLNAFRLDNFVSNIENRAFIRYQVDMDGRSSKWIASYLEIRMMEIDPGKSGVKIDPERDNLMFRSNAIATGNPVRDWYRTMRTSNFEKDLFQKEGIKFTSMARQTSNGVRFRAGKITTKDGAWDINVPDNVKNSLNQFYKSNGDPKYLNALSDEDFEKYFQLDEFGSHKEARKAIKTAVNSNTEWYQVMKRLYMRKGVQNMIGVRDWRFFDKTRTKLHETKVGIRNKIIQKALPNDTKTGKVVQCLFGVVTCKGTTDPNDPQNHDGTAIKADGADCSENPDQDACKAVPGDKDNPDGIIQDGSAENGVKAAATDAGKDVGKLTVTGISVQMLKTIATKINAATGVVSVVQTLDHINKSMANGSLTKLVYMARATQAIGLWTTYSIARDQVHSGQLTASEMGDVVSTVDGASTSEGWDSVINPSRSSDTASADSSQPPASKTQYCSQTNQDFIDQPSNADAAESQYHYLCDNEKIGGADAAKTITDGWNGTIGKVLGPVFDVYDKTGIGFIADKFNNAVSAVLSPVINGALSASGLSGSIENISAWLVQKSAQILGAGPAITENSPSGVYVNHAIMGAGATAETAMRFQGAARTTSQTAAATEQSVVAYQTDQNQSESLTTKYLSLENPQSLFSTTLFNLSSISGHNILSSIIGSIGRIPATLMSSPTSAADVNGYAVANFAGVNTYDFPSQCLNANPIDETPQSVTNADDLGLIDPSDLTWDLVQDSNAFYEKLYENAGDDQNKVAQIDTVYDCAILDSTVAGSLGAMYGGTAVTGPNALLSSGSDGSSTSTSGSGSTSNFLIATGNVLDGGAHASDSNNVCRNDPGQPTGDDCLKVRSQNVADFIKGKQVGTPVSIMGFQEVSAKQFKYIKQALGSQYGMYPETFSWKDGGPQAIVWDTSKFTFVDGGVLAYPWYNIPGYLPWVELQSTDGQTVYIYNEHMVSNHDPVDARVLGVVGYAAKRAKTSQITLDDIAKRVTGNATVYITGDFSSTFSVRASAGDTTRDQLPYCLLTANGEISNVHDLERGNGGKKCPSTGGGADQIYASSSVTIRKYKSITGGIMPGTTDHPGFYVAWVGKGPNDNTQGSSGDTTTPSTPNKGYLGPEGFPGGECVLYVKWILERHASEYKKGQDITTGYRGIAAYTVADNLGKLDGYTVNHTPAVHAVVSFPTAYGNALYGHVGIVAQIYEDGSIEVEESNWPNGEHYGHHHVPVSEVPKLTYAHTEDGWK